MYRTIGEINGLGSAQFVDYNFAGWGQNVLCYVLLIIISARCPFVCNLATSEEFIPVYRQVSAGAA